MRNRSQHPTASGENATRNRLNPVWLKAAVLGCLWASSEIILGSFLHNLRIPFSSILLSSVGMILLISVHHQWTDRGLIWRAGLICALMKSVSPSAVIFGPMIAIFSEAVLLNLSVILLGRNIIGYIAGSILATSWSFIQKAINYILFYGFNIIDLYESLVRFAEKQLQIRFEHLYTPLLLLWGIYLFAGLLAALAGLYIGRTAFRGEKPLISMDRKRIWHLKSGRDAAIFPYSVLWLIFSLAAIPGIMILMNRQNPFYWLATGAVVLTAWVVRYRNILRPLRKPKFWIMFLLITMAMGFLVTEFQSPGLSRREGLMIGLQMNFRAAVMIVGFSVVGKELGNPLIRNRFSRSRISQAPMALEVAFETLPFVIANTPPVKTIIRQPIQALRQLSAQAGFWLTRMEVSMKMKKNIIIISGRTGDGKTTLLAELVHLFQNHALRLSGTISPAVFEEGQKTGYRLINLADGKDCRLSSTLPGPGLINVGRFYFYPDGIDFGNRALTPDPDHLPDLMMVDEVGAWELQGQGWAPALHRLILEHDFPILLAVNENLTGKITEAWQFKDPLILKAGAVGAGEAFGLIMNFIQTQS